MALAAVENLTVTYGGAASPALRDVSLSIDAGEAVALLGLSGAGKSTLVRALAGLVPHFHGGRFEGRVCVGGLDTRRARPADLAGTVAVVFQDPEDQVVMSRVLREVAFGLENVGVPAREIKDRAEEALDAVGALELRNRRVAELSGGELQRVCLASALALRPGLLLLDEPTSQLDESGAATFLSAARAAGCAVVLSEQRIERALSSCERAIALRDGGIAFTGSTEAARTWLEGEPDGLGAATLGDVLPEPRDDVAVELDGVSFAYGDSVVVDGVDLAVRAGEIVALEGPNGCGKTTVAKLAAGLLEPSGGTVTRAGRAGYLSQDPGRYLVCDRVDDEVALGVGGSRERALAALEAVELEWATRRHPRDLSSGERERLGIAAVAVAAPDLLVLDEPTRGVDPLRKRAIERLVREHAARGAAVIVATHDRAFGAHRRVKLPSREIARV